MQKNRIVMKKQIGIRIIVYFVLLLLTLTSWYKSNDGIENLFVIFPIHILLFEIIFLQIKHKKINLFAILHEMGREKITKQLFTMAGSIVVLGVLIGLFTLLIVHSLQKSAERRFLERDRDKGLFKEIYIDQRIDSVLTYAIYNLYTKQEAEMYQQPYFEDENYVDSISNGYIDILIRRTSMLCNDTVPFPSAFKIRIYHKNELIKEYDYDTFIKEIQKDTTLKDVNPLSLNSWTLTIDSTLFDIK